MLMMRNPNILDTQQCNPRRKKGVFFYCDCDDDDEGRLGPRVDDDDDDDDDAEYSGSVGALLKLIIPVL